MKKHLNIIFAAISAVMGILALIAFALPTLVPKVGNGDSLTLADISFGYEQAGVKLLGTSILYVLALVSEIIGLLLLIPLFFNLKKGQMIFSLLSLSFFLIPVAILLGGGNDAWVPADGVPYDAVSAAFKLYYNGSAIIVAVIALIVAAVFQVVYVFLLRKQQKASK